MISVIFNYLWKALLILIMGWFIKQFILTSILNYFLKLKYGDKVYCFSPFLFLKILFNPQFSFDPNDQAEPFLKRPIRQNPNMKALAGAAGIFKKSFFFNDPAIIREGVVDKYYLLKKQNDNFPFADLLIEFGLFNTDGDLWKKQRNLIAPFFKFDIIKDRIPQIKKATKFLIQRLQQSQDTSNLLLKYQKTTGDVVCASFFGTEILELTLNGLSLSEELASLMGGIPDIFKDRYVLLRSFFVKNLLKRSLPDFLLTKKEKGLLQRIYQLRDFITQQINKRESSFDKYEENGSNDFLQIYIRAMRTNPDITSKEEILQQFISFYFAGMDTTAHTVLMMTYVLGAFPDIQKKVLEEIDREIGQDYENLTFENVRKLDYLHCLLNETLRMYTPIISPVNRIADKDMTLGEFQIKKGDYVGFNFLGMMNDPKYFPDYNKFNPDRWLDKNSNLDPFVFIPFNAGPRNCIGQHMAQMEAKIMIVYLLKNFRIEINDKIQFAMEFKIMYTIKDQNIIKLVPLEK